MLLFKNNSYSAYLFRRLLSSCQKNDNKFSLLSSTKLNVLFLITCQSEKVFDLFDEITIKLDSFTLTVLFNTRSRVANDRAMKIGKKLHDQVPNNYRNNNVVLASSKNKGIITYGAMMNGYNMNDEPWKCVKIFNEMKQQNIASNEIVWNLLIGACSKIGMIRQCQNIVDQIPLDMQN
ncbi:unnamed protein product [Rotaria socialis]|uniref:Pentatricopeptide repeat-containing protein n=1 Tax=Rotaria socialis TaxID=392032 RepID=A0A818MQY1_9BILA|nr:unnamed protein product [Rotaria socialis]CAF3593518.1 unnamed protein product [Rotaria socialis]